MDALTSFIFAYNDWIRFFHVAGVVVALGSVVTTDIFLLFLKLRPNMAPLVAKISPILSLQIWIGFVIISLTGLLLFIPMRGLEGVGIFQLKMALVLLVFINGVILNVWVTPKFNELAPEWSENTSKVKSFTKVAGVAAAVSFIGWWAILLLMMVFY